jgi:hypothetical protein
MAVVYVKMEQSFTLYYIIITITVKLSNRNDWKTFCEYTNTDKIIIIYVTNGFCMSTKFSVPSTRHCLDDRKMCWIQISIMQLNTVDD